MLPGQLGSLLEEANSLSAAGEGERARELYRQIVQEDPLSAAAPEAYTRLAEYELRRGFVTTAIDQLNQALSNPEHPIVGRALSLLGEAYHHQDNLQQAWGVWSQLATMNTPEASLGWRLLLESYFAVASPENTPILLSMLPAGPLQPERAQALLRIANLQTQDHLDFVSSLQPTESPLAAPILLARGDQAVRASDDELAKHLWTEASKNSQTMQEALYRLEQTPMQPPFKVGLMLPLSGRHAKLGNNLLQAAQKALTDYRDVPISLVVADSGSGPKTAEMAVHNLHAQQVNIIIGPVLSSAANAAAVQAVSLQLPIMALNPMNAISKAGDQVYRNALSPQRQAKIMANYAVKEREFRRIAILAPDSDYGRLMTASFSEEVLNLNGEIVGVAYFDQDSPDFSPWIKVLTHLDPKMLSRRLRQAKKTIPLDPSDPLPPTEAKELEAWADFDALFLPTLAKQIRLIAPQAAFFNIRTPNVTLLGTSRWNRKTLFEGGTDYLRGAVFLDTDRPLRDQFRTAFRQAWQEDPTNLATLTYDGVAIVAQLLREQRVTGVDWRTGLTDSSNFSGVSGAIRFHNSGISQRPYRLFQVARRGVTPLSASKNIKDLLNNRNPVIEIPDVADKVEQSVGYQAVPAF